MKKWLEFAILIAVFVGTVLVYRLMIPELPARPPPEGALRPVNSPVFKAVGYSPRTQTLRLLFHDGYECEYAGVPPGCYREFLQVGQRGAYFNRIIRGRYPCRRVGEGR